MAHHSCGTFWWCLLGGSFGNHERESDCGIRGFVSLRFSPNRMMVFLNLLFITLTVAFIAVVWLVNIVHINYLALYCVVCIGAFSVYDIYDDLIMRTVEGSN